MKTILMPVPSYGFDPSETAIPWKILTENNIKVVFATPSGLKAQGDQIMLTGKKLGIWKSLLVARKDAIEAYREMENNDAFCNPISYESISEHQFDGIVLPGGHDKGVKEYLESKVLQQTVVNFFSENKPVGSICHGMVLLARSIDPSTNQSVIYNYKTTCLLESQEMTAYQLTRLWLKDYYLTYPGLTVEQEVKSALENESNFLKGKFPMSRDSKKHLNKGFYVKDRNLISARWPGDAYNFSLAFVEMMKKQ